MSPKFCITIFVLCGIFTVLMTGGCVGLLLSVHAASQTPAVYPLDSKPYGLTYSDWGGKQWQWLISIPSSKTPMSDNVGMRCTVGQQGPVWFLLGTSGGKAERSCTIPSGKALFLNILTSECSNKEYPNIKSGPDLLKCAVDANKGGIVSASVDGVNIPNIQAFRVQSPSINVVYPSAKESVFPVAEGGPSISHADGWYVMLKPLSTGAHTIHFSGSTPPSEANPTGYATDVKYHLTVK